MYLFELNTWQYFAVLLASAVLLYAIWRNWLWTYKPPLSALPLLALFAIPLGFLAGHAAYFVFNHDTLPGFHAFFLTPVGWRAGYSSLGIAAGVMLAVFLTALIRRIPLRELLDRCAPLAFPLAIALRTGCLLNGCCYGVECALPWALRFPEHASATGGLTPPSHPYQLYELLAGLAAYALLPWLMRRLRIAPGSGRLALLCLALYALIRLSLGFLRNGATDSVYTLGMSLIQLGALGVLAASATILLTERLKK